MRGTWRCASRAVRRLPVPAAAAWFSQLLSARRIAVAHHLNVARWPSCRLNLEAHAPQPSTYHERLVKVSGADVATYRRSRAAPGRVSARCRHHTANAASGTVRASVAAARRVSATRASDEHARSDTSRRAASVGTRAARRVAVTASLRRWLTARRRCSTRRSSAASTIERRRVAAAARRNQRAYIRATCMVRPVRRAAASMTRCELRCAHNRNERNVHPRRPTAAQRTTAAARCAAARSASKPRRRRRRRRSLARRPLQQSSRT